MIEASLLTKLFDDFVAVEDLNLSVGPGQLLALLGPNGAGKTTTVRMLGAILKPSRGTARIDGLDIVGQASEVRRRIGVLTEQPGLYSRSSGLEYLVFFGRLYGLSDRESERRALTLFDRFAMPDTAHRRLGQYSKGMRQKVGLIRAMLHDPSVLLLDEPTSAMDPHSAKLVRDAIIELRHDRRAIIVCTHNLAEAELLADHIAIISRGRIIASGRPAELKRQLLGKRCFEIEADRHLNARLDGFDQLVTIERIDGRRIRYRTDDPETHNPHLVRLLSGEGVGVITLQEISASLEEVYLNVVAEESP